MNRRYRLSSATDFQRVWRTGKSYAHPLVVCAVCKNDMDVTRFGVTTKRGIGNAVIRNRARRRLRAALQQLQPQVANGWDIIVLARPALLDADWQSILSGITILLKRAGLLEKEHERARRSTQRGY